ncbi:MAG: EmrB/QacA subfamily drug resistance transporter [Gammaproteobacteria bacterium]
MKADLTADYYRHNALARLIALINICLGTLVTVAALASVPIAVPAIAHDLQANAIVASWIPVAFLLANLVTLLPAGRTADIYGRKKMYIAGFAVFLAGNLVAGLVRSIEALLICRMIQGVGSAMLFSPAMAIVSSIYRDHGRGAALGWVITSVYVGLTCGPFLGGWITDQFGWQYIFLSLVPVGLISILLTLTFMKGEWKGDQNEKVDWMGSIYFTLIIGFLFFGITGLPNLTAIFWLAIAFAFQRLFVRHLAKTPFPLLRLKLVRQNKIFSRSLLASTFLYGSNFSMVFVLGLYLQYNRGLSPTDAGQLLMIQAIVMALMAPISGKLSDRFRPRVVTTLGSTTVMIGLLLILALYNEETLDGVRFALIVVGCGFGLFSSPNNSIALGSVEESKLGISSAMLNLSRLMGQMIGTMAVTLLITVFIGNEVMDANHHEGLQSVLQWFLCVAIGLAASASWFSMKGLRE